MAFFYLFDLQDLLQLKCRNTSNIWLKTRQKNKLNVLIHQPGNGPVFHLMDDIIFKTTFDK